MNNDVLLTQYGLVNEMSKEILKAIGELEFGDALTKLMDKHICNYSTRLLKSVTGLDIRTISNMKKGATYWNIHGRKEFVWRCVTRIEQGPEVCKNRTVKEDELYGAVMTAINKLLAGGNNMIKTLEENIHAVIGETTEYQISEINNLLEEKQKELIKLANKGQDYEHLADEIDELRDKRQTILVEDASHSSENERINELIEFIRKNKFRTLEYDDKLVRKIIQSVTVYEDHFVIAFKSGIEMEI